MEKKYLKNIADFLFESGMLAKTPRSGFYFLGSGKQSVAEHVNRVTYIAYALAKMAGNIDEGRLIKMCMFHDLAEARVSDLNYVHQKYNERNEEKAIDDLTKTLPFGDDIKELIREYEERRTNEAKLAKDSDNLEFILSLKEQADIGNERALIWISLAVKRLITDEAKGLAEVILKTDSDDWWFSEKTDEWWVNRTNNK